MNRWPTLDFVDLVGSFAARNEYYHCSTSCPRFPAHAILTTEILYLDRHDLFDRALGYIIPKDTEILIPELATAMVMANNYIRKLNTRIDGLKQTLDLVTTLNLTEYELSRPGLIIQRTFEKQQGQCSSDTQQHNMLVCECRLSKAEKIAELALSVEQTVFHIQERLLPINEIANKTIKEGRPFGYMEWLNAALVVELRNTRKHPLVMTTAFKSKVPPAKCTECGSAARLAVCKIKKELAKYKTEQSPEDDNVPTKRRKKNTGKSENQTTSTLTTTTTPPDTNGDSENKKRRGHHHHHNHKRKQTKN